MVLTERSMVRVLEGSGPAFVCRLLNWENLEWGSITLGIADRSVMYKEEKRELAMTERPVAASDGGK